MSKVSTADCKKFLADYFRNNPKVVLERFFDPNAENPEQRDQEILDLATNSKNWKRIYKCNPGSSDYVDSEYAIFTNGCSLQFNTDPNPYVRIGLNDVVSERGFDCDGFDGQLAHIVLEMNDGSLLLADYIGD